MIHITDHYPKSALLEEKSKAMGESNTLLYIVAVIVIVHIVAGIGYLLYKIGTPAASEEMSNNPEGSDQG